MADKAKKAGTPLLKTAAGLWSKYSYIFVFLIILVVYMITINVTGNTFNPKHISGILSSQNTVIVGTMAIGMALMTRAAATLGYCAPSVCEAVESLLTQYGLPTENPYSLDALAAAVLADKKMDGASIHIAVPYAIGDTRLVKIGASELRNWLTAGGVQ